VLETTGKHQRIVHNSTNPAQLQHHRRRPAGNRCSALGSRAGWRWSSSG